LRKYLDSPDLRGNHVADSGAIAGEYILLSDLDEIPAENDHCTIEVVTSTGECLRLWWETIERFGKTIIGLIRHYGRTVGATIYGDKVYVAVT
jgi:hypothetical protein